jgi:ribonuclease BN (tRNA processing enzyme)
VFSVRVLGSGTGVPCLERCGPGYFIRIGRTTALVDCGNGAVHQLLRAGEQVAGLDAVFVTHAHADHISDLVPLIHALILDPERSKPLRIIGPDGFSDLCQRLILPLTGVPDSFEIRVADASKRFTWAECQVLTTSTVHSRRLASVAYRFEYRQRSVVFSGDTDDDLDLSIFAQGADLLVLDCSFTDAMKAEGHLAAGECGRLAARASARRVLLSHIYAGTEPAELRIEQCKTYYSGPVQLAEDLMELTV